MLSATLQMGLCLFKMYLLAICNSENTGVSDGEFVRKDFCGMLFYEFQIYLF